MASISSNNNKASTEQQDNDEQEVFYFAHQPTLEPVTSRLSHISNLTDVSTQKDEESILEDEKTTRRLSAVSDISNASTVHELEFTPEQESDSYGWFIVLAAFLSQVVGLGVMQDYYEQHVYGQESATVIKLSLVGTLGNFALNVFSPFVQILVSTIGIRSSVLLATILSVAGLELSSFTSEVWQLQLTQGILFGGGGSIIFYIGMSSVQQWFSHKKSGIALGISTSGSCFGGLIMPLIITPINRRFGISTCFRILGGITCILYLLSGFLFKDKTTTPSHKKASDEEAGSSSAAAAAAKDVDIKPVETTEKLSLKKTLLSPFKVIQFDVLKDVNFILWCLADIVIELSYYTPLFFLPSYATSLGLKDTKGSSLISITASCNAIGRIFAGMIADRIGHINTVIITGFLAGCSAFLIWTFAYNFVSLVFFAAIFGFFGGAFVTLGPSTTAIITGMDRFKSGYSLFLLVTMVAMFGPNLAGALEAYFTTHYNQEPYLTYKLFTGVGYILGVLVMVVLKWRIHRGRLFSKL
ncbi:hypothetical protein MUCCIDRAFT_108830 [Mucor lusitanicus CBS 277.49]|uniref:Major facilitator superfamily (MFS) profile domain-containing protein n=1 Tax=Mucor lusitanicus CBS 277.49 TaxID=747725 RepID=A0A168MIF4_MUCCL|nr:hypothetical protein MUCCIDRAFT_108830 [Mucor lusitanicus CBS 277.49]